MNSTAPVTVVITIDTEEDDWGAFHSGPTSVRNIRELLAVQESFDKWGARPSYLVNRAPLIDRGAVEVLGALAARDAVEIGAHCHPWNTPPLSPGSDSKTMMYQYGQEENRAKLAEVKRCLHAELGVTPKSFRAGRWGFGSTVASALLAEGIEVDCSVSPFVDWSSIGGPDYSMAPHRPYRLQPEQPLVPVRAGALAELPPTIGYPGGDQRFRAGLRRRLERSVLRRFKVVGIADRAGFLAQRWLSPETATTDEMLRLTDAWVASGESFLHATFHSTALLPGATPFVRDGTDRKRFLHAIDRFLEHCGESGFCFRTLQEASSELLVPA